MIARIMPLTSNAAHTRTEPSLRPTPMPSGDYL